MGLTLKSFIPPIIYDNLFEVKQEGGGYFYVQSSSRTSFKEIDYLNAFNEVPEVNSIISMKARAFSNMKVKAEFTKTGEEADTPETKYILNLLNYPNWFQAGKEFTIQTKTMREIFGNEYIYSQVPFGFNFSADRIKQLFTIPSNLITSKYNSKSPFYLSTGKSLDGKPEVVYLVKKEGSVDEQIPVELIIHLNDNRVNIKSTTDKNLLKGDSKLMANAVVINNIKASYEARGVILENRGADGAWVNKSKDVVGSLPLEVDEKGLIQNTFKRMYGTMKGQSQSIITNQDLVWVQAGIKDPAKLGLYQEIQEGFNRLQDSFGVPPEMFVRANGSTYENQKQAEKGMYIRTIIPEANEWVGGLSNQFFPNKEIRLIADYSHLPMFQEDLSAKATTLNSIVTALSKMLSDQAITIDQYKEEIAKYGISKT